MDDEEVADIDKSKRGWVSDDHPLMSEVLGLTVCSTTDASASTLWVNSPSGSSRRWS